MGTIYDHISLSNLLRDDLRPIKIAALVDSSAITTTTAMVLGTEVLRGAIPMQDMDVLTDLRNERLIVPPDRPNFALSKVK